MVTSLGSGNRLPPPTPHSLTISSCTESKLVLEILKLSGVSAFGSLLDD